jgi:hypothetical protein
MIEKAVKQVFHVYPFFNVDILMFSNLNNIKARTASHADTLNSKEFWKYRSKVKLAKLTSI